MDPRPWRVGSPGRRLRTFIERKIKPELWEEQEERTLRIFKRKAHHFLDRTPAEEEEFEWLALMQHHGAPTRLLDFTWSPYVAAFFALEYTWDMDKPDELKILPGTTGKSTA